MQSEPGLLRHLNSFFILVFFFGGELKGLQGGRKKGGQTTYISDQQPQQTLLLEGEIEKAPIYWGSIV